MAYDPSVRGKVTSGKARTGDLTMIETYRGHGIEWTGDLFVLTDSDGDLMGEYDTKEEAVDVADVYADEQEASDLQDAKDDLQEAYDDIIDSCETMAMVDAFRAYLQFYRGK